MWLPVSQDLMPPDQTPARQTRKRKLSEAEPIAAPVLQPSSKRRKSARQHQHRTPSSFWDNLSRQWLTPRALREFDRRTTRSVSLLPPDPSALKTEHIAELKRFARHGGPSLSDLRAYPETTAHPNLTMSFRESVPRNRAESSSTRNTPSRTSTTRKTSAYDAGFGQHLIDYGIYPNNRGPKPSNWEDINNRLGQQRPSLSPSQFSEGQFERFEQRNEEAYNEAKVMSSVLPIIAGNADIPSQENIMYTNIAPLTDGTITAPKPDFYDGALPQQLDRRVREKLGPYISPSTDNVPLLPNLFAEAKGPKGRADVAQRQMCYDGAIGARAMLHARSYASGDDMEYDGNAYTITSTYRDGMLKIYTTHPTQPTNPDGKPSYHMTKLRTFAMTDIIDTFRHGAGAFRNARDWAKEQRDIAITRANEKANNNHGDASGIESPGLNLLASFGNFSR